MYSKPGLLEDDERLNIIRLALEDNKKFVCSDIEMRFARENKRQLKTYETLKLLKNKYDNLALLIGADNFHF